MTPAFLAGALAVALSLAFSYVPALKVRFEPLPVGTKRLIMLGGVVAIAVLAFGLNCAGISFTGLPAVECSQKGVVGLAEVLFVTAVANQGAYGLTPKS